jgi:putative aldouronate transport system substrate-binding protein
MVDKISRREFLTSLAVAASAAGLAACKPQEPQVVKETVVVKEEVEVPVEETVVVEREVAPKTVEELLPAQDKMGSPDNPRGWKTILPDLPGNAPFEPPVTISTSKRISVTTQYCGDDTVDDNPWFRMIEALFNVKFEIAWTWGPGDSIEEKYNLAAAAGDLPDFLETVPLVNYMKMVEADQLEDLTEAYEMYASPRWQATWREYGERPWVWTKINGRIYGLPRVEDLAHNDSILWYREDWLEKVGMNVPTTFEALHDVALAFAQADLGMGAEGTTIGLASNAAETNCMFHTWFGGLDSIWGGFGYIPDHWQPEGDGLMYGSIRPEVKEALALLAQWYQDGVFATDWYTKGPYNTLLDVAANVVGLHFTPAWGAWPDSVVNDPTARWNYADIPVGPYGFKRRHTENNFRNDVFAFRKGVDQRKIEASLAVADWWDQLWHEPWRRFHGWEGCNYIWEGDRIRTGGEDVGYQDWSIGPIGTPGSSMVDPKALVDEARFQLGWEEIPPEKRDAMQELVLEDPTGCLTLRRKSLLYIVDTAGEGVMTKLQRTPTETEIEKGADLAKIRDEAFINIIIGQQPLSDFDKFVEDWKKAGGDDWTREVNDWWQSKA